MTGEARAQAFPNIPTFTESGVHGMDMYTHWGVLTRAGTPAPVLRALADAFSAAVLRKNLRARLNELSIVPLGGSPAA